MQKRKVLYAGPKCVPAQQEFVDEIFFQFFRALPPTEDELWDEEAVSKVAKEVHDFFNFERNVEPEVQFANHSEQF